MTVKRPYRSAKYQYMFCETLHDETFWHRIEANRPYPLSIDEKEILQDYDDQIRKLLLNTIKSICTKRQYDIFSMTLVGMTQVEIAEKLGCNQSCINKTMHGNVDHTAGVRLGGISRKVINHIRTTDVFIALCNTVEKVLIPESCYLPYHQCIKACFSNEAEYELWLSGGSIDKLSNKIEHLKKRKPKLSLNNST